MSWSCGAASVIGAMHRRAGQPCQDHSLIEVLKNENCECLIACVSDGAGSALHAETGAAIVCSSFADHAAAAFRKKACMHSWAFFEAWHALCCAEINAAARRYNARFKDFAATALLAVISAGRGAFFQIGDGAIVVSLAEDDPEYYSWVFWPEKGEDVNATIFVTSENVLKQAHCVVYDAFFHKAALFSDGLEDGLLVNAKKEAHQPFFKTAFSPEIFVGAKTEDISRRLKEWLANEAIFSFTHDDKSLVLAKWI